MMDASTCKGKVRLLGLLFLLAVQFGYSQGEIAFTALLLPDSLKKNADEIIRSEEVVFTIKSIRSGVISKKKIVTILNENSTATAQYAFYDDASKVNKMVGKVYDSAGRLVKTLGKKEIVDRAAVGNSTMYSDTRIQYMEVNYNRYPYTIEFEQECSVQGLMFYDYYDWSIQDYYQSIEKAAFEMRVPEGMDFYHKAVNIDLEPQVRTEKGMTIHRWEVNHLKAIPSYAYNLPDAAVLPAIWTSPKAFKFDKYTGSMEDWKTYGDFCFQLYEDRNTVPPALAEKVKSLTQNLDTDLEKIDALYKYMQDNTRYVSVQLGIGGFQPFDVDYVDKNKFGDCKALTNYMQAMLREVGIKAYPTLIYRGEENEQPKIFDDFTNPVFNHVVLTVPSEDIWLECTSNNYPINYVGSDNANRRALLLTEEGGTLIDAPKMSAMDNQTAAAIKVWVNEDGSARLQTKENYRGQPHEVYRYLAGNWSAKDQKDWYIRNSELPPMDLADFEIGFERDAPKSHVQFEANLNRYASKAGTRLFIPINLVTTFTAVPGEIESRQEPIHSTKTYVSRDTITIHFPEGFNVESMPAEKKEITTDYLHYSLEAKQEDQKLIFYRYLERKPFNLPATEYEALRKTLKSVAKMDAKKVVLVKKRT